MRTNSGGWGSAAVCPVSAEHGIGVDALLDEVTATFPVQAGDEAVAEPTGAIDENAAIKVAIIGRPNVGKSTLLNALVGQDRAIVSPIAGTTRDAVDETVTRGGHDYVFVDTAGIRRKSKTNLMAEKLSVVMARRHIRMAHVVLLVLDATEGVVGLDATIAGYAHEGGRALILCVNKWDQAKDRPKSASSSKISATSSSSWITRPWCSSPLRPARAWSGCSRLIREVYESASRRISTGELNRFVEHLKFEERKIYYMTQASIRPPSFVAVHRRPRRRFAFFPRALPDQPDPQTIRFSRHADSAEDTGQRQRARLTTPRGAGLRPAMPAFKPAWSRR